MKSFFAAATAAACVEAAAKTFTHTKAIASKVDTTWTWTLDTAVDKVTAKWTVA